MIQPASCSPHNIPEKILAERINLACIRPYITDRARDQRCIWLGRGLVESDIKVLIPVPSKLQYYDSLGSNAISIVTTNVV